MSEEQEQLPDWLLSMRGQSLEEPPIQQSSAPPFPEEPSREEEEPPNERVVSQIQNSFEVGSPDLRLNRQATMNV